MNMKKLVALLLALVMVFALCACGSKDAQDTDKKDDGKKTAMKADDIPDEMTSSDGKYQVAFVTDVGSLKDKSFNQGTYDGVKLYANANSKSYKYYQPANGDKATDDDRYDAMKAAVDNGAEVVVAAGFLQGAALEKAAKEFTDTKFVFIDGSPSASVKSSAATWPAMLPSWKATPSSASRAAAAARTMPAAVTATVTFRALRLLQPKRTSRSR